MKRLLAFVAAAAMVAGSLAWRASRDDGDGGDNGGDGPLRLVCSPEVEAACEAFARSADDVEVTVEPAGVTAARLATADGGDGLDAWVVPDPWPRIVDDRRRRTALDPVFAERIDTLARSRLALAVWDDVTRDLGGRCDAVDWRCVGDHLDVADPGHPDPTSNATGLLVLGQIAVSFFGRTDLVAIDLEDPAFDGWFTALERAVPRFVDDPLTRMLVQGPSAFDAVGVTEAEARPLLDRADRGDDITLLYPEPVATADVVVAAVEGDGGARLADLARDTLPEALREAGWSVPADAPSGNGLPSPGFLDALSARWSQVVR